MTTLLKVQLNKMEILEEVKNANRVLSSRNNLPVTEVIILSFQDTLTIKGTDGSKYFESVLDINSDINEEFSLNRELFFQTLGSIQQETFTLVKENERVTITASNEQGKVVFNTTLFAMRTDDVPKFPETNLSQKVEFETSILKDVFDKTDFSVAKDNSRETLKGIHIEKSDKDLIFSSTDSHRLSVLKLEDKLDSDDFTIIVYPDFVAEVKRQVSDMLSLEFNEDYIVLKSNRRTVVFPLIQGKYPPVQQLFPETHKQVLKGKVSHIKSLVESASFIASKTNAKAFNLLFENGELTMTASHSDFGNIELQAENIELENNDSFKISLNNQYVNDILSKFNPHDTVTMELTDNRVTFSVEDSKLDFRHLIIGVKTFSS